MRAKVEEYITYALWDELDRLRTITEEYDEVKPVAWEVLLNGDKYFILVQWDKATSYQVPFEWLRLPPFVEWDVVTVENLQPKHGREVANGFN